MKFQDSKLILKVELFGKKSSIIVEALIDTGAAYTLIPPRIANLLELELDKEEPYVMLSTASGVIGVTKKIINEIKINGLMFKNIPAVIHELPEPTLIKVLIGMNLLMKTKLIVDGKKKEFILENSL